VDMRLFCNERKLKHATISKNERRRDRRWLPGKTSDQREVSRVTTIALAACSSGQESSKQAGSIGSESYCADSQGFSRIAAPIGALA